MSETAVRTRQRAAALPTLDPEAISVQLAGILPGVTPVPGDPVSIAVPGIAVRANEHDWVNLLGDPEAISKRRGLLEQIHAILELNDHARSKGVGLKKAARERAEVYRRSHEAACTGLLEQNRTREQSVRSAALFFANLQSSRLAFRNKVFAVNASLRELDTEAGRAFLAEELSRYVDRPDPRRSRAFLVAPGWIGNRTGLKRLERVVYEHRCMLVTDGPSYADLEKVRVASAEGGLLESLPGNEMFDRYAVLLANYGRARARFRGRYHEEKSDVFVPLSGAWFGMYLDRIAQGKPWKPTVGYQNPIPGIDGVELDLRLKANDHFDLYLRHRLNPALVLSAGGDQVVVWGPDTLSKAGRGVQIGVAVVELILTRYAEWIVNQYGLLNDLEEAEDVVRDKLTKFMVLNSGAGRMFRAGSRVRVHADHETRTLAIEFELLFRELAERAVIRVSKPLTKQKVGRVAVEDKTA